MLAERVEDAVAQLSVRHGPSQLLLPVLAGLGLREGGAAAFAGLSDLGRHAGLLVVQGAASGLPEHLVEPLAAAGVQAAGGGRGGQAVRVPLEGELLPQSRGQRVHGAGGRRPPLDARVQGGAGVSTGRTVGAQICWGRWRRDLVCPFWATTATLWLILSLTFYFICFLSSLGYCRNMAAILWLILR